MTWGRLDDGLYDHPKLEGLGRFRLAGVGLWTLCISWSNHRLTDGVISAARIKALGGSVALADRLVSAGLLERAPDGYSVHDFLEYNDPAVVVHARRKASAERQRRSRSARVQVTPPVTRDHIDDMLDDARDDMRDADRESLGPARTRSRPDPAEPRPLRSPPKPPIHPTTGRSRANGTSPRQLSAVREELEARDSKAQGWRRRQRQLAYLRGAITAEQRAAMDTADAPVEDIPDWNGHLATLAAEASTVEAFG